MGDFIAWGKLYLPYNPRICFSSLARIRRSAKTNLKKSDQLFPEMKPIFSSTKFPNFWAFDRKAKRTQ